MFTSIKLLFGVLLTVATCAVLTPSAQAQFGPFNYYHQQQRTSQVYFGGTSQFMSHYNQNSNGRATGIDAGLIWSSDGCGGLPRSNVLFAFNDQCVQHDFAYRNFGNLYYGAWAKDPINDHFEDRMRARCGVWWIRYHGGELACEIQADIIREVVDFGSMGQAGRCSFWWSPPGARLTCNNTR